jgi:DNA-binding MarR family transcriptional regulator
VGEQHEVSDSINIPRREAYQDELLMRLDEDRKVSQRSLAGEMGIALGLTNLLLRRLVALGWVQVVRLNRNHAKYLLTPLGLAERARIKQKKLEHALRYYADARDRVRSSLDRLSREWPDVNGGRKRIALYGANELTEIASVCLKATDLELVGVVDDAPSSTLVHAPVLPTSSLQGDCLGGVPFDRLVVMSLQSPEHLRPELDTMGVAPERIFWI